MSGSGEDAMVLSPLEILKQYPVSSNTSDIGEKIYDKRRSKILPRSMPDFRLLLQIYVEFKFLQIKSPLRVASPKGKPHPVSTPALI